MDFTSEKLREIADREHVPADAQEALYAAAARLERFERYEAARSEQVRLEGLLRQNSTRLPWYDAQRSSVYANLAGLGGPADIFGGFLNGRVGSL